MPNKNENLYQAKKAKNDEFYTRLEDIENELKHYEDRFQNKIIFCNCDDPEWSNFWIYFHMNFERLGLKKLISTHYEPGEVQTYKMEYTGGNDTDFHEGVKTTLTQNGDFRSPECVALMDEADIVITNPPFSIAREFYVPLLFKHHKKFIIIGDLNWATYKFIFPLIKENKIWAGFTNVKQFMRPDGTMKHFGNKMWYTNFDISKRHEILDTPYLYSKRDQLYPDLYPKFDNYDAINIDYVKQLPMDYNDVMGVPVSFLNNYNPEQFQIVGLAAGNTRCTGFNYNVDYVPDKKDRGGCGLVNGVRKYARLLIKRK